MSALSGLQAPPQPPSHPRVAWVCAAVFGVVAPLVALVLVAFDASDLPLAGAIGPVIAIGMMGAGMIAGAADGRFGAGLGIALGVGAGLLVMAQTLGLPALAHLPALTLAVLAASISFAARGALFARSQPGKGWAVAVFVVAGEAAIIFTAIARPQALPGWLLALLPAQWTSLAIQSGLNGSDLFAAWPALVALIGTAAATMMVARLLPNRWPYLIMFTTWLSLSALVYYQT